MVRKHYMRPLTSASLLIFCVGAITAFFVGFIHTLCGYAFMAALAIFFFTSSWLTKYKGAEKSEIEASYKEGKMSGKSMDIVTSFPSCSHANIA